MSTNIYSNYLPLEKSGDFIKQVIFYENGKYTFSCYPVSKTVSACGRMVTEQARAYSGYRTQIHTCQRRSKKQDDIAISEAKHFYETHQLTTL